MITTFLYNYVTFIAHQRTLCHQLCCWRSSEGDVDEHHGRERYHPLEQDIQVKESQFQTSMCWYNKCYKYGFPSYRNSWKFCIRWRKILIRIFTSITTYYGKYMVHIWYERKFYYMKISSAKILQPKLIRITVYSYMY